MSCLHPLHGVGLVVLWSFCLPPSALSASFSTYVSCLAFLFFLLFFLRGFQHFFDICVMFVFWLFFCCLLRLTFDAFDNFLKLFYTFYVFLSFDWKPDGDRRDVKHNICVNSSVSNVKEGTHAAARSFHPHSSSAVRYGVSIDDYPGVIFLRRQRVVVLNGVDLSAYEYMTTTAKLNAFMLLVRVEISFQMYLVTCCSVCESLQFDAVPYDILNGRELLQVSVLETNPDVAVGSASTLFTAVPWIMTSRT